MLGSKIKRWRNYAIQALLQGCLLVALQGSLKIFVGSRGTCGPGSSIGIVTGYGLDGPGIESFWGAKFSAPVQTGPGAHPASCTMGTGSFLGVKRGRDVTLTPHPLLVPWSTKSRAIPLVPQWAVRPVQSLSGCTRVYFTFTSTLEVRCALDTGFMERGRQIHAVRLK